MNGYELLGVTPAASPREIQAAFRRYARLHHPDLGGDPARFRAGVEAYRRVLSAGRVAGASVVFHRRSRGLAAPVAWWRSRRRSARRRVL